MVLEKIKTDFRTIFEDIKNAFHEEKDYLFLFIGAFFIVHGEMIFNKLSWHDDIASLWGFTGGTAHGRFFQTFISVLLYKVSGIEALPVINAAIMALCLFGISVLVIHTLNIEKKIYKIAIMLICISLPSNAESLGYVGSAGYNIIGAFITTLSAYIAIHHKGLLSIIISIAILALGIGEYQCYLTLFLTFLLCGFIKKLLLDGADTKELFNTFGKYAATSILGLLLYLILLRLSLWVSHLELMAYAGTDTYGVTSLAGYWNRIVEAYQDFFVPIIAPHNLFPFHWGGWHALLLILLFIGAAICFVQLIKERKPAGFFLLCMVFLPFFLNFNFVLYDRHNVRAMHQYQYIYLFVIIVLMAMYVEKIISSYDSKKIIRNILNALKKASIILIIVIGCLYIRYDNVCYMDAEIRQQQAISYFTTLISDMHNADGYYESIPVCYVNKDNKATESTHSVAAFDKVITDPYFISPVDTWSWQYYMYEWCNFKPEVVVEYDDLSKEIKAEIENMPNYPDNGSIKVVDGILIVKF